MRGYEPVARAEELDPMPIIGETVPLEELADAIERARSKSAPLRFVFKA